MLKASNSAQQRALDKEFQQFQKTFAMLDTGNEHEALVAFHKAQDSIVRIREFHGQEDGPNAFGFAQYVRLSVKHGDEGQKIERLRQENTRLQEKASTLTKERDQAKAELRQVKTGEWLKNVRTLIGEWVQAQPIGWDRVLIGSALLSLPILGLMMWTRPAWTQENLALVATSCYAGLAIGPYSLKLLGLGFTAMANGLEHVLHYWSLCMGELFKFAVFAVTLTGSAAALAQNTGVKNVLGLPVPPASAEFSLWFDVFGNHQITFFYGAAIIALYFVAKWLWRLRHAEFLMR